MSLGKGRRVWVIQSFPPQCIDPISHKLDLYNTCFFCGFTLENVCMHCVTTFIQNKHAHQSKMKRIWQCLLMARNRHDTLFSKLDFLVIAKIMNHVMRQSTRIVSKCKVALGATGHVMHRHCVISERNVSPPDIIKPLIYDVYREYDRCAIVNCFQQQGVTKR